MDNLLSSADNKPYNLAMLFLILASILGLAISIFLVVHPSEFEDDFASRNLVVGSAFGAVCVLGILAALYPKSCSGIFNLKKRGRHEHSSRGVHGPAFRQYRVVRERHML